MAIMSSRLIRHEICKDELRQMGARVISIQGVVYWVKFELQGIEISYAYHIIEDNTYYLERIKPYFMNIGHYTYEEEIVDVIRIDVDQFKNAMRSSNFDHFIEVDGHISKLVRIFEDLFMYYNIDKADLARLDASVDGVLEDIKDIMKHSTRVYTMKDPEVLKENIEF
ncbi:MAG: hypothetical protein PWQ12_1158 [Clostridiales bacterium]|jgi:hypothetical protein|nr:hypothetical protein [Clostridiales bacterium]